MNRPLLSVEDNDDDVFFMQQVKRRAGTPNPLHIVDPGEKAIAYLKGENGCRDREKFPIPGLILMDLKLP
jgi:hypothetical protein